MQSETSGLVARHARATRLRESRLRSPSENMFPSWPLMLHSTKIRSPSLDFVMKSIELPTHDQEFSRMLQSPHSRKVAMAVIAFSVVITFIMDVLGFLVRSG